MCFRTKLNAKIREIEKTFDSTFIEPESYEPQQEINAFDFSKTPVITDEEPGTIQYYSWGLIPAWAKDPAIRKMTLNARVETLTEKPAFRDALQHRCLIIADGFYEWQWKDPKGKVKQKYLIRPKDQEVFAFAGIYSHWLDTASRETISSYAILTTKANELMSRIHNNKQRMPVILHKKDQAMWLHGLDPKNIGFPYEVPLEAIKM